MLKTSSIKSAEQKKDVVWVSNVNRVRRDGCELDRSEMDNVENGGGEVEDDEVEKKGQKTSKSKKTVRSDFFTLGARLAFTKSRQAFVKTPIFYYFDLEHYIWFGTDVSGYAIGEIFN